MVEHRTVAQQIPALVVVALGDRPERFRCVELLVTLFSNGDWEVAGPSPSLSARGEADSFERSIARLVLGIGASSAAVFG